MKQRDAYFRGCPFGLPGAVPAKCVGMKPLLELYRNLARLRPDWTFHMHHQDWNGRDPFSDTANVVVPPARRQRVSLPRLAAFLASAVSSVVRADVLHCHGAIAPRFPLTRMITTIHDLTPLEFHPHDPDVKEWAANVVRGAPLRLPRPCVQ